MDEALLEQIRTLLREHTGPLPAGTPSVIMFEDGDQVIVGLCTHVSSAPTPDAAMLGLIRMLGGGESGAKEGQQEGATEARS